MTKRRTRKELRKERFDTANKFAESIVKKFGPIVKCVVTWGSITREKQTFHAKSDIDCLVIVDDLTGPISDQQRAVLDIETRKIAKQTDKRISIQPVWTLSELWAMIRHQSPLVYSVLREGWALYDTGFFVPLKKMYNMGQFAGTTEAAYIRMGLIDRRLALAEHKKIMIVFEEVFHAMLEAAQGVLVFTGKEPPGIRGTPDAMRKYLVDEGLLEEKWADEMEDGVKFYKGVEHGKVKEITGAEVDKWIERGRMFISRMNALMKTLENVKKTKEIVEMTNAMLKGSALALKSIDKLPKDPEKLQEAIKKELIETGTINPTYAGLIEKVLDLHKKVKDGKVSSISEEEVYSSREYVRRFMFDVRRMFREKQFVPKSSPSIKKK